mmetsp:Transcript_52385/g.126783  ORF Transcript_52385/g.126783 Transcript_52385/m.126783 type:complete len:186 (+) Transcript_52385:157-714(+)
MIMIMILLLCHLSTTTTTTSPKLGLVGLVVSALDHDVCIETSPPTTTHHRHRHRNSNKDNDKDEDEDEDSSFVCTRDVLELREQYDGEMINVGITQRVDGAETERKAIRDVLHQMDMYFFEEVLAFPEYSYARSRCKNSNELCAFWASVGECETNRVFMLSNCPAACRFCLLLHSGLASASESAT